MYNVVSWYNRNRKKIWTSILAIIIISLIAYGLINMTTNNSTSTRPTSERQIDTNSLNSVILESEKSVISGQSINIDEKEMSAIDDFISNCNSGKIAEAYSLISNECKEEMYPEIKNFEEFYYKPVFGNGYRNVSIENWTGNIYKVLFKEDVILTGRNTDENSLEDYITIVKDDEGNAKLNINKYIGRNAFEKSYENDYYNIKLLKTDSYMDYEIYTFEVQNKLEQPIALGDVADEEFSYLVDENELRYNAFNIETTQASITITALQTKTIQIKYDNKFSSGREINQIVFPRIIVNYDYYKKYGKDYLYSHDFEELKIGL